MLRWIFIFFLVSCSSNQPVKNDVASVNNENRLPPSMDRGADHEANFLKARAFDRFLRKELNPYETFSLAETCKQRPDENVFCYSIEHFEELEQLLQEKKEAARPVVTRHPAVRPKIVHGKITNWAVLQTASIGSLLKGLAATSPADSRKVAERALRENECPNNIAVAAATNLEDLLPDRANPKEIAGLYRRGAECVTPPADKETLFTRAGLFFYWAKDFETALDCFTKASDLKDAYVGRSLYWKYRAQLELSRAAPAKTTLQLMKSRYPFSFHTLVALTATKNDPGEILAKSLTLPLKRSMQAPITNILIEQVELLREFSFHASAAKVLDWTIAQTTALEPEVRIYLAELKREQGDYPSKIAILSEVLYKNPSVVSKESMELYFPKVFFPIFEKNAAGIDPLFLLAVARQESAFNVRAVSNANAKGLLQVHPRSAPRFNRGSKANLLDPQKNVEIAARMFIDLTKRMNGQIHLALGAYNAGPGRISTWTSRYPTDEPILFIDLVPYRETREYIASVLRNYYWYRRIHQEGASPKKLFNFESTNQS